MKEHIKKIKLDRLRILIRALFIAEGTDKQAIKKAIKDIVDEEGK